jgi:hypothetical protein
MRNKALLSMSIVAGLIFMTGCNMPVATAATPMLALPPAESQTPAVPASETQLPIQGVFTVAVLVDLDSEAVTETQAQAIVDEASAILFRLTGFVLEMVDFREVRNAAGTSAMVGDYINSSPAVIPNGILLFSFGDDNAAKTYGGYSFSYVVPDHANAFQAPDAPAGSVYVNVVHYGHRFARCGYGDSDTPVSDVSIDGECFNQPGTACLEKDGYQMCSTAVDHLYASTPTYMASSTLVHEIMHPFGPNGNLDHYHTDECTSRMASGTSQRPYHPEPFDRVESDSYVNMCPFVFDIFVNSYQP